MYSKEKDNLKNTVRNDLTAKPNKDSDMKMEKKLVEDQKVSASKIKNNDNPQMDDQTNISNKKNAKGSGCH